MRLNNFPRHRLRDPEIQHQLKRSVTTKDDTPHISCLPRLTHDHVNNGTVLRTTRSILAGHPLFQYQDSSHTNDSRNRIHVH